MKNDVYYIDNLIKLISKSRFNDNLIIKGSLIESIINNINMDKDLIEITFKNINLNKFNINRVFYEILRVDDYKIESIEKYFNYYILKINCNCNLIKITINSYNDLFPKGEIYTYKGYEINIYSINDLVSIYFYKIVYLDRYSLEDFHILINLVKKNLNYKEIVYNLKNIHAFYNKNFDYFYIKYRIYLLKDKDNIKKKWDKFRKKKCISITYNEFVSILDNLWINLFGK